MFRGSVKSTGYPVRHRVPSHFNWSPTFCHPRLRLQYQLKQRYISLLLISVVCEALARPVLWTCNGKPADPSLSCGSGGRRDLKDMSGRVWARSEDRTVEWVSMRADQLAGAIDVMRESFFPNETISKALLLNERKRASAQVERLARLAANDGVSIVAVEVATGRVIGVAFNKIQVNSASHSTMAQISEC